jgi:hypothetical protein
MEKFFLEHHVMKDRDKDDLNKRCNSDSEARYKQKCHMITSELNNLT